MTTITTPDNIVDVTPEEWANLATILQTTRPRFDTYWVTREFLEDSRIPPETIFGFPCRCVVLFDEPEFGTPEYDEWEAEENQKAMDAFWAERQTT